MAFDFILPKTPTQFALLLALIVVIYLILFAKPHRTKTSRPNKVVALYNSYLWEVNDAETKFTQKVRSMDREIILAHDVYAKVQLTSVVNEYKALLDSIYERLAQARSFITRGNSRRGIEILLELDRSFLRLDNIAKKCDFIKIKEHNDEFKITKGDTKVIDSYFDGCSTKEELNKRFRGLAKVFHPDTDSGSNELYIKLREEYERRMKECL